MTRFTGRIAYISILHSQYFRNSLYLGLLKLGADIDLYPAHTVLNPTKVSPDLRNPQKDLSRLKTLADYYDYVIISPVNSPYQKYLNKFINILKRKEVNFTIVDLGDLPQYRPVLYSDLTLKYFKREFLHPTRNVSRAHLLRGMLNSFIASTHCGQNLEFAPIIPPNERIGYESKAIPFFLGISDIVKFLNINLKKTEKLIDVSFVAKINNPLRREVFSVLSKLQQKYDLKIITKSGISLQDYYNIISSSKVSISVPGIGFDTFRYYEIPYFKTALVSLELPIVIPNDFDNWKSAVFFKSPGELEDIILELIMTKKWKRIGRRGNKKIIKNFLDVKLARYFLKKMEA